MFHVRDRRTSALFDPWAYLGPKRKKLLDRSWAGLFRKEILPHLPVEAVVSAFHARLGRPSKDAYTLMGALIFQQMYDTTDEETVRQLAFNIEWHYALDLPGESDEGKYVCVRTLLSMRQLLAEKKLDRLLFGTVTQKLASVFSVDTSKQRLDSVHITSNMRRLSRIGIFVRVITGFLTNLERREPELFATLAPSFGEKYLSPRGQAVFSMVRPSESDRTLSRVAEDLFVLARRFECEKVVASMKTYALLSRVFAEQCAVVAEGERETVAVKPPEESWGGTEKRRAVAADHPRGGGAGQRKRRSRPAAGDREGEYARTGAIRAVGGLAVRKRQERGGRRGDGRRGRLPGDGADRRWPSDAGRLLLLRRRGDCGVSAGTRSDPVPARGAGGAPWYSPTEVVWDVRERRRARSNRSGRATGSATRSGRCGWPDGVPRRRHKRSRIVTVTDPGLKSTMSAFDRMTGVKHLRVRGFPAVRFAVVLKALGVNLFRAAAAWTKRNFGNPGGNGAPAREKGVFPGANSELVRLHAFFKSVLVLWIGRFIRFNTPSFHEDDFVLKRAA